MQHIHTHIVNVKTDVVEEIREAKEHLRRNKKFYIGAAGGLAFAGISSLIMRSHAGVLRVPESNVPRVLDGPAKVTVTPRSILSNRMTNNIVTVIERDGRGHPGYLVRCLETNEIFSSQYEAAKALGTTASIISGHLRGKLSDVDGLHLERIGLA